MTLAVDCWAVYSSVVRTPKDMEQHPINGRKTMAKCSLLPISALCIIAIALAGANRPATAASFVICDAPGCGSPDPNITFNSSGFQVLIIDGQAPSNPNNPNTIVLSENCP